MCDGFVPMKNNEKCAFLKSSPKVGGCSIVCTILGLGKFSFQRGIFVNALGLLLLLTVSLLTVHAERIEPPPSELEGVSVTERLNDKIPFELTFKDENGKEVALAEYFHKGKPVLLTLNYYECPMLCTLQLNGLVEALREINLYPGKDFEIVTASINPLETYKLAKLKKQNYIQSLGSPDSAAGWHFLTGKDNNIKELTRAVGFNYRFDPQSGEFAHVAALILLTPDGRISRYLYDVLYDPKVLRLSIIEASQGRIGTFADHVFLYCYRYNSATGKYTPIIMNIVRLAGTLTVAILAIALSIFWARDLRHYRVKTSS